MFVKRQQSGFTIIEMTVAISLVVIMMTLMTVNYRNASKRTEIILAAQQVGSMMRLAESFAASAKEVDNVASHNIWGLSFDKSEGNNNKVILFVDKNEDGVYSGEDEKYQVYDLPAHVIVDNFWQKTGSSDDAEVAGHQVAVTFVPPDPKVRFCDAGSGHCSGEWNGQAFNHETWDRLRVVLKDEVNGNSVKNIQVNYFGMIDVPNTDLTN